MEIARLKKFQKHQLAQLWCQKHHHHFDAWNQNDQQNIFANYKINNVILQLQTLGFLPVVSICFTLINILILSFP